MYNSKDMLSRAMDMETKSSHSLSHLLLKLYKRSYFRKIIFKILLKIEGGEFLSENARRILKEYHDVDVGQYTYGCLAPGFLPRGTVVGRFCSIAKGLHIFRRNHPISTLSQHPYFYNRQLGLIEKDTINYDSDNPLIIGNDVWIGNNVTVLPSCKVIRNGAIIGAGSVVTKDVEAYSVVAGNPGKKIKYRHSTEIINSLEQSRWWTLSLTDLLKFNLPVFDSLNRENVKKIVESTSCLDTKLD